MDIHLLFLPALPSNKLTHVCSIFWGKASKTKPLALGLVYWWKLEYISVKEESLMKV